jgi:SAM-dependent methyltransferase
MDAHTWDARHADPERGYSRGPSAVLVAEMSTLPPGFALDLACGQGRHAVWLARHGWRVTAVDFSRVALARAEELAREGSVTCDWTVADLDEYEPVPEAYDLVVISYLHLPGNERRQVLAKAERALAPGGTLLLLGLDRANHEHGHGGPSNPAVLYDRADIVAALPALQVERAATITRAVQTEEGDRIALDLLVRARRPAAATSRA